MSNFTQDWETTIIKKRSSTVPVTKRGSFKPQSNQQQIKNTVQKIFDPNNPDEPEVKPVLIERDFGLAIQKARTAKGLTQKELANALSIPVSVINDYEKGTGVRNGNYVSKIKKYLSITK